MERNNTIEIVWNKDGTGAHIVAENQETRVVTSFTPIEIEALILTLCQSPWRLTQRAEGVMVH